MVEAAGVELNNVFCLCNLQILKGPQNQKIDHSQVHRTVIVQSHERNHAQPSRNSYQNLSIPHFTAVSGEELVFPLPFSGFRKLPHFEMPDTGNLNQFVHDSKSGSYSYRGLARVLS